MSASYKFPSSDLQRYTFTLSDITAYGYDQQRVIWQGSELEELRNQGLIVKECPRMNVFFEDILLGSVQECLNGTWLAHSPYTTPDLDLNVLGFANEFYAIRFLHQIIKTKYPDEIDDIPQKEESKFYDDL
jgi:hypothetical protein